MLADLDATDAATADGLRFDLTVAIMRRMFTNRSTADEIPRCMAALTAIGEDAHQADAEGLRIAIELLHRVGYARARAMTDADLRVMAGILASSSAMTKSVR